MPATFATATHTGRVRRSNEDSLFARPPVFVVADGMGGPQGGEVASGVTARAFEGYVPQGEDAGEELTNLVQKINKDIYQLAAAEGRPGMGTTVTAALLAGASVVFAHVGDSRAYLWRGGRLTQLTEDHSLVAEMVRGGEISPDEAKRHPQRSIITRALGVDEAVQVDISDVAWEPGDLFLLCSDGLSKTLTDLEILMELRAAEGVAPAQRMVQAALGKGAKDNVTAVVVETSTG